MSAPPSVSCVAQIGEMAGVVWRTLHANGAMSLTKLVKSIGQPRDMVMQAVGWLAREDKVWIEDQGRSRIISLRE